MGGRTRRCVVCRVVSPLAGRARAAAACWLADLAGSLAGATGEVGWAGRVCPVAGLRGGGAKRIVGG